MWAHQPLPLQLPVWATRLPLWVTVGGQQSARHAPVVDSVPTMEGGSAQHPLLSNKGGCKDDSCAGWCRCSVWQYSGCLALRLTIHQLQPSALHNHPSEKNTLPSFTAHMRDAVLDTGCRTHDVLPKPRMLVNEVPPNNWKIIKVSLKWLPGSPNRPCPLSECTTWASAAWGWHLASSTDWWKDWKAWTSAGSSHVGSSAAPPSVSLVMQFAFNFLMSL